MTPLRNWDDQNHLLTRLFRREDAFLAMEQADGSYNEDDPLSPRMARINAMIIRVVDWKVGRSVPYNPKR